MSALVALPAWERLQAVLMVRKGIGWQVGLGSIATGLLAPNARGFSDERAAQAAAIRLADAHNLVALRVGDVAPVAGGDA